MIKKVTLLSVLVLIMGLSANSALGAIIWDATPGSNLAIGMTNLDIGGTIYDVAFEDASFTSLWGNPVAPSPVPVFWDDRDGGNDAAGAIVNAFELAPTTPGFVRTRGTRILQFPIE